MTGDAVAKLIADASKANNVKFPYNFKGDELVNELATIGSVASYLFGSLEWLWLELPRQSFSDQLKNQDIILEDNNLLAECMTSRLRDLRLAVVEPSLLSPDHPSRTLFKIDSCPGYLAVGVCFPTLAAKSNYTFNESYREGEGEGMRPDTGIYVLSKGGRYYSDQQR